MPPAAPNAASANVILSFIEQSLKAQDCGHRIRTRRDNLLGTHLIGPVVRFHRPILASRVRSSIRTGRFTIRVGSASKPAVLIDKYIVAAHAADGAARVSRCGHWLGRPLHTSSLC